MCYHIAHLLSCCYIYYMYEYLQIWAIWKSFIDAYPKVVKCEMHTHFESLP